jgi:hypothetical protein
LGAQDRFSEEKTLVEVTERNRIRLEAGLPLLSESDELQRYRRIAEKARFKEFYEIEISKYAHLWDRSRGWFYNLRVSVEVRQRIRELFNARKGAKPGGKLQ